MIALKSISKGIDFFRVITPICTSQEEYFREHLNSWLFPAFLATFPAVSEVVFSRVLAKYTDPQAGHMFPSISLYSWFHSNPF